MTVHERTDKQTDYYGKIPRHGASRGKSK